MFAINYKDPFLASSTLSEDELKRVNQYTENWNYYNNNTTQWLKTEIINGVVINDNVNLNLARRVVNKGNNFLFGKGLTWQVNVLDNTVVEQELLKVWGTQENQNVFLSELGINGGVTGDFYLQIVSKNNSIRLRNLNPSNVFPQVDEFNDEAYLFDVRWSKGKNQYRLVHNILDNGLWEFRTERWGNKKWDTYIDPVIWPYEWSFILHGKNLPNPNSYFGTSDLNDIEINDTINQIASNLNKIIRIFAHPILWGTGFNKKDMDVTKLLMSDNTDAKLEALELAAQLGDAQDFLKLLKSNLAEITGTPESDPERLSIGAQSGFALEVLLNDLVLKTGVKQSFYGKTLIETNRRLADLLGFSSNIYTKLYWPKALPQDYREQDANDKFALDNGLVSKRTISIQRGYNYDDEQVLIANE